MKAAVHASRGNRFACLLGGDGETAPDAGAPQGVLSLLEGSPVAEAVGTQPGDAEWRSRNNRAPPHGARSGSEATESFGIIALRWADNRPQVLMVRSCWSYPFTDYVRGRYAFKACPSLVAEMAEEERALLRENPDFDSLWRSLYGDARCPPPWDSPERAKHDYTRAWVAALAASASPKYREPEWGFPKGRRINRESDLSCALREFEEETGCSREDIEGFWPWREVEEYMDGGQRWRLVYFLATVRDGVGTPRAVDTGEVGKVSWMGLDKAHRKVRDKFSARRGILEKLMGMCQRLGPGGFATAWGQQAPGQLQPHAPAGSSASGVANDSTHVQF